MSLLVVYGPCNMLVLLGRAPSSGELWHCLSSTNPPFSPPLYINFFSLSLIILRISSVKDV